MKRVLVAMVLGATLLVGCGDDDDAGVGSDDTTAGTETENVLRVTEDDYSYAFDGDVTAGAVTFAVENIGDELHMLGLCKLQPGKTLADAQKAAQSDDEAAFGETCVEGDAIDGAGGGAVPGTSYEVTLSGIGAGTYAAICFIPDESGKPHFQSGMIGEFEIADGESTAAPEPDVTFTASAEKLDGPTELDAGRTTIELVPEPGGPDEVTLLKIKDGKTADEVDAYFKTLDEGGFYRPAESPVEYLYFGFDSTDTRLITVDLTPGNWAIAADDSDEEGEDLDPDEDPHVIQFTVA